jgi:hypothetical protein
MGKDEEEGRMKIMGVLLVEFQLVFKPVPRIVKRMDFVHPE